jgi:hypothetical protein
MSAMHSAFRAPRLDMEPAVPLRTQNGAQTAT